MEETNRLKQQLDKAAEEGHVYKIEVDMDDKEAALKVVKALGDNVITQAGIAHEQPFKILDSFFQATGFENLITTLARMQNLPVLVCATKVCGALGMMMYQWEKKNGGSAEVKNSIMHVIKKSLDQGGELGCVCPTCLAIHCCVLRYGKGLSPEETSLRIVSDATAHVDNEVSEATEGIEPGDRVGAILTKDKRQVQLIGFGVYDGDFIPPKEINSELNESGAKNPRITLDNGEVVWGCESWWGREEKVKDLIRNSEVIHVNMNEERARAKG